MNKGIVFFTDNQLNIKIAHAVQKQLKNIGQERDIPIVSSSLKKMAFGNKNVHFPHLKKGYLTMFKQILGGLENSSADIIFLCEHDVLYHPSHFDFIPPRDNVYHYNVNVWKLRLSDGHAITYNNCKQVSGLCAYRQLLIGHYRKRIAKILQNQKDLLARGERLKNEGFSKNMGYEPGLHSAGKGVDDYKTEAWLSRFPNVDIRHDANLTKSRWSPTEFHNKSNASGWREADVDHIPGWENIRMLLAIKR